MQSSSTTASSCASPFFYLSRPFSPFLFPDCCVEFLVHCWIEVASLSCSWSWGKVLAVSLLSTVLVVGFSYMPFIRLQEFPSVLSLFSVFIMKECRILLKCFSCSGEITVLCWTTVHSWNECHMVMAYSTFYILLGLVYWNFLADFWHPYS